MGRLRCDGTAIVMQEVPDEISLAINVTECPHHCVGCHSPHLAESYGEYVGDILEREIQKYKGLITCVCFMGGDQHMDDLAEQCWYLRTHHPELKIAVYTGSDNLSDIHTSLPLLDYVKIGHYDHNRGGLSNPNTNQLFFGRGEDGVWRNLTYRFWKGATL